MKNVYTCLKGKCLGFLKVVMMVLVLLGSGVKGWGQNVDATWGGNGNSAWYTGGNWAGGLYAGLQGIASANTNVATFTSAATGMTFGINMNTNSLNLGAISIDNTRTIATNLGNSSATAGFLRLYGSTVNSVPNVVLRNNGTGVFTLQAAQNGAMDIVLSNASDNIVNIDNTGGVTISSILSGTGNLTKAGAGAGNLILSGLNTYTGATTINAGSLNFAVIANGGIASGIGASSSAVGNLILGGGTLSYTGANASSDRGFTLTAATISSISTTNTLTLTGGSAATTGALSKTGAGTLELTGANLYTGLTTVATGTLQLNRTGGTTLPIGNDVSVINAGTTLRISTNQTLNDLRINNGSLIVDAGVTLTINGAMIISGPGTITNNGTIAYGPTGSLVYSNAAVRTVGVEWPNVNGPYNVTLNNPSTNISLGADKTVLNKLTMNSTAVLTGTGFVLTVLGDWDAASAGAYTGGINPASAVVLNGSGAKSFTHVGGATFRNLTFSGAGTYTINNDINISVNTLTISNGIVNMGTNTLNGSGDFTMTGGLLRLAKLSTTLPELTGTYTFTAGTIELNGAGDQVLRGARDYRNLTFSTSGTKTVTSPPTSITGTVTVANAAILDVTNNSMGGVGTNLTMTGTSRYKTAGVGTKPDAQGTYTLGSGTTVEFTNTAASQQDIRLAPSYYNIDVSGTNVGNASLVTGIGMQAGSVFTVKTGGTFNLANTAGFTGSAATAISSTNSPAITLESNSTINYNGAAQAITNTLGYQNVRFSGTGVKTAPATDLIINGNLSRAGTHTFNANSSRVVFQGTTTQTYSATVGTSPIDFYNLSNSNPQNLIVDSTFGILNELNLTATAKLNLNIGDIIMRSSATRTAYIVDLGTTTASTNITYGTGLFSIERYLFGKRAWRLLATPIEQVSSPSILNSWQEAGSLVSTGYGTQISGPAGGTGLDYTTQRGSLKWFDTTAQTYVEITNTNNAIARTEGYYVFVRGDRAQGLSGTGLATNLRIKGKILTGTQPDINLGALHFASVGNPYPSAIDFRNVFKSNMVDAFIAWNPNSAGSYNLGAFETYTLVGSDYIRTPGGEIRDSIQSGEAVFVQTFTGGGILRFEENDKVGGSRNVSRDANTIARNGVTAPTLDIDLYAKDVNGSSFLADGVKLNFGNSYSNALDNDDVRKISNTADNLSVINKGMRLVVERRNTLQNTDTIFLNLSGTRIASYRFEIDPSVLTNTGLDAFLRDKFLQTETPVSLSTVTNVQFDITADAASRVVDRFMIVFKQTASVSFTTISAERSADKTVTVKWGTEQEVGVANYEVQHSNDGINFTSVHTHLPLANNGTNPTYSKQDATATKNNNWYRVKANMINGTTKYSGIAMVEALQDVILEPSIAVYPNPVEDKLIKMHFVASAGKYTASLINAAGKTVYTKNMVVISDNETQTIEINKSFAAGNYSLVLVAEDGTTKILKMVIL
jgi:autotransporter-associated beta strand protein